MMKKWTLESALFLLFALLLATPTFAAQPSTAALSFSISPTALNFGSVAVGAVSHRGYVTVTNISGSTLPVSVSGGATGVFGGVQNCQGRVLRADSSCHFVYRFRPDALGLVQGGTDGTLNGQPYTLSFTGTRLPSHRIRFTDSLVAFGTELVPFSFQVDTFGVPPPVLSVDGVLPAGLAFVDEGNGEALISGTPRVAGSFAIRVRATTPARTLSKDVRITLAPTQFLVSPTTIDFGPVPVGTTGPTQAVTITNISGSTLPVSVTGGAAGVFGGVQNCQGEVMVAGQSCQFLYAFSPTASGFVQGGTSGTLNGQPFALTFTGAGT